MQRETDPSAVVARGGEASQTDAALKYKSGMAAAAPWSGATTPVAPSSTAVSAAGNGRRQIIGKYELGKVLAVGDFDCWTRMCTHTVTGAEYVVRTYRKDILSEVQWMWDRVHDSIHVQRFLPKHEGIVDMVECFETETTVYILMQLFPSINATQLYTTRHLSSVAPFLAETLSRSPGMGPRGAPPLRSTPTPPIADHTHAADDGGDGLVITPRRRGSPPPSALPVGAAGKAQGAARRSRLASGSPPSGRTTLRTPPLEPLALHYTSPPPAARVAAGGSSSTPPESTGNSPLEGNTLRPRSASPPSLDGQEDGGSEDSSEDAYARGEHSAGTDSATGGRGVQRVPVDTTRRLFIQVVRAVQHMHRHSVVHLGLAPDHVMVNDSGTAKVGNLISCRACVPGEILRELRGTRQTVAPEVLRGDAYDPFLADSWSLGVLLYFMLNDGRYPHDGANTLQHVLYQHIRQPNPSIPPTAKDLLARLLQMNPANRLTVDAIVMHPFCVGTWQHIEEESHRRAENNNTSSVAAAAAAAVAAVGTASGHQVDDQRSRPGHPQPRHSSVVGGDDDDGTRPAPGAAGQDAPFASAVPDLATSPLVIASARLLGEPRRRLSFMDDHGGHGPFSGAPATGASAFARARGVFLRAPGANAHVWGQGQGEYGQDVGAGAGLLFEVQTSTSLLTGASHYGTANTAPLAASSTGTGAVVANTAAALGSSSLGLGGPPGAAGARGTAWGGAASQRIKSLNAAALLGARASAIQSSWDPVQEAFSMDIPPGLTRENEAAYVIQHTFRAYLQRRRFRRGTRRLNHIGWVLFEGLYASPPPAPAGIEEEDDGGRSPAARGGRAGHRRSYARGGSMVRRPMGGGRPRGLSTHALSSPAQRSGTRISGVFPSSPPRAPKAYIDTDDRDSSTPQQSSTQRGNNSSNSLHNYEVFSIDSSTSGSSKVPSRAGSASSLIIPAPNYGSSQRRSTLLPGVISGSRGVAVADADDMYPREGYDSLYSSRGGLPSRRSYARADSQVTRRSRPSSIATYQERLSLPTVHSAYQLPRLFDAAGAPVGANASAVAALAMKASERDGQLPLVSPKADCPLCHRPPPMTKRINIAPYALTQYAYKNGAFTRSTS